MFDLNRIIKICRVGLIFGLAALMFCANPFPLNPLYAAGPESQHPVVSLKVENENLTSVLGKISEATGYEIVFDSEWGDVPVSVQLNDESLDDALGRVLGNLNHALIWNEPERKISVFIYGYAGSQPGGGSPAGMSGGRSAGGYQPGQTEDRRSQRAYSPSSPSRRSKPTRSPTAGRSRQRSSKDETEDTEVSVSGRRTRFEQATKTTTE